MSRLAAGGDSKPPPKNPTGGWYRVKFVIDAEDRLDSITFAAVPSTRHLRRYDPGADRYIWMDMTEVAAESYRKIAAGIEPRPISTLRGLDQKPPEVIVDEVVMPPEQPATQTGGTFSRRRHSRAAQSWWRGGAGAGPPHRTPGRRPRARRAAREARPSCAAAVRRRRPMCSA